MTRLVAVRSLLEPCNPGPIGDENKVVEADETYIGGKAKNRKGKIGKPRPSVLPYDAVLKRLLRRRS